MTDFVMADEMEDDLGDFDAGGSTNSDNEKVDSILIKKILCEMKSEFNRATCSIATNSNVKEEVEDPGPPSDIEENSVKSDSKLGNGYSSEAADIESNNSVPKISNEKESLSTLSNSTLKEELVDSEELSDKAEGKPRIILTLRPSEDETSNKKKIASAKPGKEANKEKAPSELSPSNKSVRENIKEKTLPDIPLIEESTEKKNRRSQRNIEKCEQDLGLKRSSRRMSRESVLQSAIALKEKSFGSLNSAEDKPHRRSLRNNDEQKNNSVTSKAKQRPTRYSQPEPKVEPPPPPVEVTPPSHPVKKGNIGKVIRMSNEPEECGKVEVDDEILDTDNEGYYLTEKSSIKGDEITKGNKKQNKSVVKDMWIDENSSSTFVRRVEPISVKGGEAAGNVKNERTSIGFKRKSDMEDIPEDKKKIFPGTPCAAEGSEPPLPADNVPKIIMANSGSLCECQTNNELYAGKSSFSHNGPQYCKAVDTIENRKVGCCNMVEAPSLLLRPSRTIPHVLLCSEHVQRLERHNACPSCGIFCTKGVFMLCNNNHFYHKDCEIKKDDALVCPHCGSEESIEAQVSFGVHKYPVFLPMQKLPNKYPSARMSLCSVATKFESKEDGIPKPHLVLPSGKIITSDGLPRMDKEKYTYRNLWQASKNGQLDKVIHILGSGISPNQPAREGGLCALHAAASNGHLSVVHALIQAGANPDILDKERYTPLMLAALNNHNEIVKYLFKSGANITIKGADGMTALHIAAKEGNLEACQHLVMNAHTPRGYVDTVDDGRWTPLVWAAENCCTDVVRFLLENGADPQIRDSEMNIALHWAAFAGSMEISESLLHYGSNINLSNTHGDTPLHIAARQGAEDCVILLLMRGAKVDMMNKAGQIARDCVPDKNAFCFTAIEFNMLVRRTVAGTPSFPRLLSNDVSRGYESNPIQCINEVDEDGVPTDFTYITENCFTTNLSIDRRISSLTSCKCEDLCNGSACVCTRISYRSWYDKEGKLFPEFNFEDPPMIFECNQKCTCNALICKNRVVQRGIKVRLQLTKTRHKNWGVITLVDIPKGSYVCEYIGEIISDCEADTREDDSYLFDLDSRDGETFCIDARIYGNIARFINHSCKPNLSPVRVFIGHHDLHFPRIAFFANRDIAAFEELGFDYGEKFWIIKCKSFTCMCAADSCRYSDVKIQETLEKYREKLKMEEL